MAKLIYDKINMVKSNQAKLITAKLNQVKIFIAKLNYVKLNHNLNMYCKFSNFIWNFFQKM